MRSSWGCCTVTVDSLLYLQLAGVLLSGVLLVLVSLPMQLLRFDTRNTLHHGRFLGGPVDQWLIRFLTHPSKVPQCPSVKVGMRSYRAAEHVWELWECTVPTVWYLLIQVTLWVVRMESSRVGHRGAVCDEQRSCTLYF